MTKNRRMQESDLLFLTYSRDNDGVKVIVFGGLNAPFSSLLEFFYSIVENCDSTIVSISDQKYIKAVEPMTFLACCRKQRPKWYSNRRGLILGGTVDHPIFTLDQGVDEWGDIIGLFEGMMTKNSVAHQYLVSSPIDDAEFIISRGEKEYFIYD
ncbi:hypothetical protein K2Y11_15030 [bacterium]|nr:hypothetical protein [bacterium]